LRATSRNGCRFGSNGARRERRLRHLKHWKADDVATPPHHFKEESLMSIFGTIVSKIFGTARPAETLPAEPVAPAPADASAGTSARTSGAPVSAALADVDVAAVMDQLAAASPQQLDWRRSIVDLMKLLDVDSSLEHRKALAGELKYGGEMNDSVSMNIWLHKQLMTALAANGGKLPAGLAS
jgi:hypothetical protein